MPRPVLRSLQKILGDEKSKTSSCRIIGLYFPGNSLPCSQTTCNLIHLEEKIRQRFKTFQTIIVSKDENEANFNELSSRYPWKVVPFANVTIRIRLHRIFRVSESPAFVITDWLSGHILCSDAISHLQQDPEGRFFPWQPTPIDDILRQAQIRNADGTCFNYEERRNFYKALYFSASWCPPCKAFTPQLISTYERLKKEGKHFEVVFVSSDRTEQCFSNYRNSMPWPAITWSDDDSRRKLAESLEVKGIPSLVLLNPDSSVISTHGRSILKEDPLAENFPWTTNSVEVFRGSHLPVLMERPCLVLLMDEDDSTDSGLELLSATAEEYFAQYPNQKPYVAFFVVEEGEVSERLREIGNFEDFVPLLAIMDISEGLKYQMEDDVELSPKTVHNFLTRYLKDDIVPISLEGPQPQISSPGS